MKQAFTLIELLMVIAIIGILALTVFTNLNQGRTQATDSSKITGVKETAKAMELDRDISGNFPGYTSSSSAAIGLQNHLSTWPTGVEFIDNTGNTDAFCIYAPLSAEVNANYFVASQQSAGPRSTAPTLGDCNPN
ncbi:MAG: type II secretion system protein [Patescibacteria group bacterium]